MTTPAQQKLLAELLLKLVTEHYQTVAFSYAEAKGHDARCKADVETAVEIDKENIGICPRTSAARQNAEHAAKCLTRELHRMWEAKALIDFVHEVFAPYLVMLTKPETPSAPK